MKETPGLCARYAAACTLLCARCSSCCGIDDAQAAHASHAAELDDTTAAAEEKAQAAARPVLRSWVVFKPHLPNSAKLE